MLPVSQWLHHDLQTKNWIEFTSEFSPVSPMPPPI